jgi:branched-chain amino acid transport system ATP-binding protein
VADAPLLEVQALRGGYGNVEVLRGVDLAVGSGEIVALLGTNGAGKSTLNNTVCGLYPAFAGRVRFAGADITHTASTRIVAAGLVQVPEGRRVFPNLTVRENLELGSYATKDYNWEPVTEYFPKLKVLMDRKAGFLSGGERQMLMIGRAILGSPRLLLVDEPTEGLAPSIVSQLREVFRELSRKAALVIVEQNLPLVCAIAEKVYAINEGRIVAELTGPDNIRPEVCEQYL